MTENERFVRAYLKATEDGSMKGRETDWYTPDAIQTEYPNRLTPNTVNRNLDDLSAMIERGQAIVERQTYEIHSVIETGDQVAVEATFRATFKMDLLGLPKGETMTAHFAMFFDLREGRIARHRTYDCFEPWEAAT